MNSLLAILWTVLLGITVGDYNTLSGGLLWVEQVSTPAIQHTGFSPEDQRQLMVQYAYDLGGLDFVTTIECENWNRNPDVVSKTKDYWICQLNYKYNKKFIESEEYKDVYKQLDYCYNKFKHNPKLRYGPDRKIKWVKCSEYVLDRFIISDVQ